MNERSIPKNFGETLVGYADFIRLCSIKRVQQWQPGLKLTKYGVWATPPEDDLSLGPEELATLSEHPAKDFRKPALSFPCTLNQLFEFLRWAGLEGLIGDQELERFIGKNLGADGSAGSSTSLIEQSVAGKQSRRSDLLSEEIDIILNDIEGKASPAAVMKKLKALAGEKGSCVLEKTPEGVVWCNKWGKQKSLDLDALRNRLNRKIGR